MQGFLTIQGTVLLQTHPAETCSISGVSFREDFLINSPSHSQNLFHDGFGELKRSPESLAISCRTGFGVTGYSDIIAFSPSA